MMFHMQKSRFESFVSPEQIRTYYGNAEVAKEVERLDGLHAQLDGELREMQARVRETYDGDEKEGLVETLGKLRELSQMILVEMRRLQRQFPIPTDLGAAT